MKHLKEFVILFLTLAVITVTAFAAFAGGNANPLRAQNIHLGLDLAGGVTITYEAEEGSHPTADEMNGALAVIRHRLDNKGYTEANAFLEGTDRIRVEIPGVEDASEAVEEIGRTAMLQFVGIDYQAIISSDFIEEFYQQYLEDVRAATANASSEGSDTTEVEEGMSVLDLTTLTDEEILADAKNYFTNYFPEALMQYPALLDRAIEEGMADVVVTGTNVSNASYQRGELGKGTIESYVKLEFDSTGAELFAEGTRKYVGKYIAIMLDDTIIPDIVKPKSIFFNRICYLRKHTGLLGCHYYSRILLMKNRIDFLEKINSLKIFISAIHIRHPFTFIFSIVKI